MSACPPNPRIVVTGASTGIGLAVIRALRARPCRVAATARAASLGRFAEQGIAESEGLLIRPLEVTDATERERLIADLTARWGGIDVLINNAAISYRSVVEEMSLDEVRAQLETNYIAPFELIRLVAAGMRERRWGRIINISSVGGMMAMPTMGSYSASKFALEGGSEALWYELRPWNVAVTLVQPGFVHSDSFQHVRWSRRAIEGRRPGADYAPYYEHMSAFIARLMDRAWATPESIARQIVRCVYDPNPPLRVPATIDAMLFSHMRRFLPRSLYHWILYRNLPGVRAWGARHEN